MPDITREPIPSYSPEEVRESVGALAANTYPGRVVAAGISSTGGELHIVTATMGRSPSSQTRVYKQRGDSIFTKPFGEKIDPLTVYRTMTRLGNVHIATNGDQTDTLFKAMTTDTAATLEPLCDAEPALLTRHHEPDSAHTPRISLVAAHRSRMHPDHAVVLFSIIRNDREDPENPEASEYRFYGGEIGKVATAGTGLLLSTYKGDGDPLEPFEGAPIPMTFGDSAKETAEMFADVLDATGGFLVSAAVKAIGLRTGRVERVAILNKYGPAPNYPATS